ncbi:unnamed protein product [Darwinula stevensoni]|uniref:Uncharacterized protein n=1 Tax=Darwinula stevensoni TaxID=69355 RepID=A0A7R9A2A8_9CRUS|nr:unnamed protein product [Darwinula stevensoni]CAG0888354.1 unnamed protein product [Darwinula stevensoni]
MDGPCQLPDLPPTNPIPFHRGETDLSKWRVLSLLDAGFLESLRTVYVFGVAGKEVIAVKRDGGVYGLGTNRSGCLGIGTAAPTLEPRKIETLSRKVIKMYKFGKRSRWSSDIAAGLDHVLACTSGGELYSWGDNTRGQLGIKSASPCLDPKRVEGNLTGRIVKEIACGAFHSLCLTGDGEVGNVGGQGATATPMPVPFGSKAVAVACGHQFSVVLLNTGEVHTWGANANGQLGLNHNIDQPFPCKVGIDRGGIFVSQVACGHAHVLALTDEGDLYAWGSDDNGQLGVGDMATGQLGVRDWAIGQLGVGNRATGSTPTPISRGIGRSVMLVWCLVGV